MPIVNTTEKVQLHPDLLACCEIANDFLQLLPNEDVNDYFDLLLLSKSVEKECTVCKKVGLHLSDNDDTCMDCLKHLKPCNACGAIHKAEELTPVHNGDIEIYHYCQSCVDSVTRTCEDCGKLYTLYSSDVFQYTEGVETTRRSLCYTCKSNNYNYCSDCNALTKTIHTCSYCGANHLCTNCYEKDHKEACIKSVKIYSYHDLPPLEFKTDTQFTQEPLQDTLYFGFELELELLTRDDRIQRAMLPFVKEFPKHMWISSDSSISHGYEFISHPCTLKYIQETNFISKFIENMDVHINHDRRRQGLHIHASRQALKGRVGEKLLNSFIYYNRSLLELCAKRNNNTYAKFPNYVEKTALIADSAIVQDRHSAMNFSNRKTIELRIFSGIPDPNYVLGCIELYHAIINTIVRTSDLKGEDSIKHYSNVYMLGVLDSLIREETDKYANARNILLDAGF